MILLLGDIHGDYKALERAIEKAHQEGAVAIVQVGDFGLFRSYGMANETHFYTVAKASNIPIYFIDGNHDDCDRWCDYTEVTRVWPDANLFYVPRGTVMELDNRTIAFMGGAASIDKSWRLQDGAHWTDKENIRVEEKLRLYENAKDKKIDIFITHCPPNSVIEKHFNPMDKLFFGVPLEWVDVNQLLIQEMWDYLGNPQIYSGHLHQNIDVENYTIININHVMMV
jgi:Icc-related predicted phosphoesterase